MDLKLLLEKLYRFSGEPEQQPGDQVKGTDKTPSAKPIKGTPYQKHPFQNKLVGSVEQESILPELDHTAKETKLKRKYTERWEEFKEQMLGINSKRPTRKGTRPPRGHNPQPQYKVFKTTNTNKKA